MAQEFILATQADELLELSLTYCGKFKKPYTNTDFENPSTKTLPFPKVFYPNYVDAIMEATITICQSIIIANAHRDRATRLRLQDDAIANCIWLSHLIRVACKMGYISEKQRNNWCYQTSCILHRTRNWKKITQRHRLRVLAYDLYTEAITVEKAESSYFGWRQHAFKGDTRSVVLAMDNSYANELSKFGYELKITKKGKVKICQQH